MPSEKDRIRQIRTHSQNLAQSMAEAELTSKKFTERLALDKQQLTRIEAETAQSSTNSSRDYRVSMEQVKAALAKLEQAYSLLEANWDHPAWQNIQPDVFTCDSSSKQLLEFAPLCLRTP